MVVWLVGTLCVFVCLSRCLSGRFNYDGLVPDKQYVADIGGCCSAGHVLRTRDIIDDVSKSRPFFF